MFDESTGLLSLIISILTIVAATLSIIAFFIYYFFQDEKTFAKLMAFLKKNAALERYHTGIKDVLSKTDQFFGRPWGIKSFSRILLIAFMYSTVFFTFGYLVSGQSMIGSVGILPEDNGFMIRSISIIFLIIPCVLFYFYMKNFKRLENYLLKKIPIESDIKIPLAPIVVSVSGVIYIVTLGIIIEIVFFYFTKVVGSYGYYMTAHATVSLPGLGLGNNIPSINGSDAIKEFSAGYSSVGIVFIAISGIVGGVVGRVNVGISSFVCIFGVFVYNFTFLFVIWIFYYLVFGHPFATVMQYADIFIVGNSFVSLFFVFILPIANSFFDFISFEISRYLTQKSSNYRERLWRIVPLLLADLLLALALLFGTAFVIPIFTELLNFVTSCVNINFLLIDWKALALLARDYPFTKGLGITLMLFSTLVWTMIHAGVVFFSFILDFVGRKWILGYLSKDDLTNWEYTVGSGWLLLNLAISGVCITVVPYYFLSLLIKMPIADYLYSFVIKYHFL